MIKKTLSILFLFTVVFYSNVNAQNPDSTRTKKTNKSSSIEEPPALGEVFKPTIGFGTGLFSYYGDLYSKHAQSPWVSRVGFDVNLSQPLNKYLNLNFNTFFGKLGANEQLGLRNENFQSEIRGGGVNLQYDFGNFIDKDFGIRPYISAGISGFEFLTKTDLFDRNGNRYYYWQDGSIKNMAEGSLGSQNAVDLVRDYYYESDVRELNLDGFGKYAERSWAVPLSAGFKIDVTERAHLEVGTTFYFTFTDYIDGITPKSTGDRKGLKGFDKFVYTSASLNYDLVINRKDKSDTTDNLEDSGYLFAYEGDEDNDGVNDFNDKCHQTPAGVKVDKHGCPVDEDKDMIPDYRDEELPTPSELVADPLGVGITDEVAQAWYDFFNDSTDGEGFVKVLDLDSAKKKKVDVKKGSSSIEYTVELKRYKGGVPEDEMPYLLSIGDIESIDVDGETVVYLAGRYDSIRLAIQRKNEFVNEGIKNAKVGYFKDGKYNSLTDEEVDNALKAENNGLATNIKDPSNTHNSETHGSGDGSILFRVQLGAYHYHLSPTVFKNAGKIIELRTDDGLYKYVTESYKTLEEAAIHKADLVFEGYPDAFISAYKNGKRISLKSAGANFENNNDAANENLSETKNIGGSVDKSLVTFKIQLGGLKKSSDAESISGLNELKDVNKQITPSGLVRVTAGNFNNYNEATKYKASLIEKGIADAFVIASFKGEIISIQEALELLK